VPISVRRQLLRVLGRRSGIVSPATWSRLRSPVSLALVGLVVLILLAAIVGHVGDDSPPANAAAPVPDAPLSSATLPAVSPSPTDPANTPRSTTTDPAPDPTTGPPAYVEPAGPAIAPVPQLPGGGYRIFGDHRFLVAYYGTAQTGSMGVLGTADPDTMQRRLMRAARPFREPREHIQPVYELIVTVADRSPGPDHDYSHDIPRCSTSRPDAPPSRSSPGAGPGR
jgi:hypothetical protein